MRIEPEYFDPEKIAASGQCFRMSACPGGGCRVRAMGREATVYPAGTGYELDCPARDEALWRRYFDLDQDYAQYRPDPGDKYLLRAAEYARGVRILRQEPFEALISFIISQRKNIPAIRGCVEGLCRAFGGPEERFPEPRALAEAGEERLRALSLGYRAPYVLGTARMVAEGELDLEACRQLSDEALEAELRRAPGVGAKVARCVMLFAYHRLDAFPVDVWISRVLSARYPDGFPAAKYPGCAGVMQQYLFYWAQREGVETESA